MRSTSRRERALKVALIATQPLDVGLTFALLRLVPGARETNPIAAWLIGHPAGYLALLALKIVMAVRLSRMAVERLADRGALALVSCAYVSAVVWNLSLLVRWQLA